MRVGLWVSIIGLGIAASFSVRQGKALADGVAKIQGGSPSASSSKSAQSNPTNSASGTTTPAGAEDLRALLARMNQAAAGFKSAQADFEWDQYEKAVDVTDVQKGQIYFRRTTSGVDAAVRVVSPDAKQVIFKDGKLRLYIPKIDQLTEYTAANNRTDVESFMSLGFGASGEDLLKNYEVKMDGWETVDGTKTAKLDLTPKKANVKANINRVVLWLDPDKNVSLKQQFFEPSGDYRLTHYTNIKLNAKVPEDAFKLKTTSKTKVITPQ